MMGTEDRHGEPLPGADAALHRLAMTAREELAALGYPDRIWADAPAAAPAGEGDDIAGACNVVIVGGGQSALGIAAHLRSQGVAGVVLLDRSAQGFEGVWETFARMPELRTPKLLNGLDLGLPSLSVQRWYETCHGASAWREIDRIPRSRWMAYLRWYRAALALPVANGCDVTDVRASGDPEWPLRVDFLRAGRPRTCVARTVVLATGHDGGGQWRMPAFVAQALPPDRADHSNGPIDFRRLAGQRVGVLGHGASAFDNAVAALSAGAASVDLCFRRAELPRVNPHRYIETAGLMTHYPQLSDRTRWQIARHFRRVDQPPPRGSFQRALAMPGFTMHAGCGWQSVRLRGSGIEVDTPQGRFEFDHLILATGLQADLSARAELRSIAPLALRWRDRFVPDSGDEDEHLGAHPYLGPHYEFLPRDDSPQPGGSNWLDRVFAFNGASYVSQGPHSTSISGHKHALPRLVRGVTRRLFLDQEAALVDGLRGYDEIEPMGPTAAPESAREPA